VYSRKRSPYLWIKYYQHGRPARESTGTKNEVVARRMLRAREGDVERGIPIDPKVGLVTFHEAAEDMLNDYKPNRKRTYVDAKRRLNKHLAPFFANKRLSSITASDIRGVHREAHGRHVPCPPGATGETSQWNFAGGTELGARCQLARSIAS
jgi:hypothetical protein